MTRTKSTRWDCDTTLFRGIPNTVPLFHGWSNKSSGFYTGTNTRFNMCSICNSWVSHADIETHSCWDSNVDEQDILNGGMFPVEGATDILYNHTYNSTEEPMDVENVSEMEVPESFVEDETISDEPVPKYVISTEENYESSECNICGELLVLSFDEELDEWIFTDCVENENKVVHEFCFSCLFE